MGQAQRCGRRKSYWSSSKRNHYIILIKFFSHWHIYQFYNNHLTSKPATFLLNCIYQSNKVSGYGHLGAKQQSLDVIQTASYWRTCTTLGAARYICVRSIYFTSGILTFSHFIDQLKRERKTYTLKKNNVAVFNSYNGYLSLLISGILEIYQVGDRKSAGQLIFIKPDQWYLKCRLSMDYPRHNIFLSKALYWHINNKHTNWSKSKRTIYRDWRICSV